MNGRSADGRHIGVLGFEFALFRGAAVGFQFIELIAGLADGTAEAAFLAAVPRQGWGFGCQGLDGEMGSSCLVKARGAGVQVRALLISFVIDAGVLKEQNAVEATEAGDEFVDEDTLGGIGGPVVFDHFGKEQLKVFEGLVVEDDLAAEESVFGVVA